MGVAGRMMRRGAGGPTNCCTKVAGGAGGEMIAARSFWRSSTGPPAAGVSVPPRSAWPLVPSVWPPAIPESFAWPHGPSAWPPGPSARVGGRADRQAPHSQTHQHPSPHQTLWMPRHCRPAWSRPSGPQRRGRLDCSMRAAGTPPPHTQIWAAGAAHTYRHHHHCRSHRTGQPTSHHQQQQQMPVLVGQTGGDKEYRTDLTGRRTAGGRHRS
mmetsp:Transcript_16928/g.48257  ORF Transcript_16928/g.48257 Transcript_16928/m.48257 type:complete len:212 (+) Transcript_16928:96-731(+)